MRNSEVVLKGAQQAYSGFNSRTEILLGMLVFEQINQLLF